MTPIEYMNFINELEEKYAVDTWQVNNIHVWPIIRIHLATKLHMKELEKQIIKKSILSKNLSRMTDSLISILEHIKASVSDYKHNENLDKPAKVLFLGYATDKNIKFFGNKWYDILCDPFRDVLEKYDISSLLLEMVPHNKYRIPRYRGSVFIQNDLNFVSLINKFRPIKISDSSLKEYDKFNEFIKTKELGIDILTKEELHRKVAWLCMMANFYKRIIKKVKPSIGLVVCFYSLMGMAFILACRELGVVSIDIQHGVAGELHRAYGRWTKIPPEGYTLLPNVFWCWSDYEAQAINAWNENYTDYHQSVVGGNLWLEMWRDDYNDLVKYYDNIITGKAKLNGNKKNILLTLQTGCLVPDFILDIIKNSPQEWYWWIRLHPSMKEDIESIQGWFTNCESENFELDYATELPLPALLRHVDIHVTGWSAVVYDAVAFGVPSIVTHKSGSEIFEEQIKTGHVKCAYTAEELFDAICNQKDSLITSKKKEKQINNTKAGIDFLISIIK